jgi:hypothetical protein
VGQFEVFDNNDWEVFAGTFYGGARGLMIGPIDGSADDDDQNDASDDDEDVTDAIKAKLKMYVDLEGTIRNIGFKADVDRFKKATGKIWSTEEKKLKYSGHHLGRVFPTFANTNGKLKYSVMHRAGERATNVKSIRGDLNPTYQALLDGTLEFWCVTPHRFTHDELTEIKSFDEYTDPAKYPHLGLKPDDEVPKLWYVLVAKSCPDPLIVQNGAVENIQDSFPFNPRFVGRYNPKAEEE